MVRPSNPNAKPRRDGYLERRGTWGEVTVGSLIAGANRTDVWEIVDSAHPQQVQYAHTLWFKAVNRVTGEVYSVPPRFIKNPVVFLMRDDEETPPPATPAGDAEAVALLAEKLGAMVVATRDHATGEILCPDYDGHFVGPRGTDEYMYHLRVCHGMDTSGLETLPPDELVMKRAQVHEQAHNFHHPEIGKGGFPHRHGPEDHTHI